MQMLLVLEGETETMQLHLAALEDKRRLLKARQNSVQDRLQAIRDEMVSVDSEKRTIIQAQSALCIQKLEERLSYLERDLQGKQESLEVSRARLTEERKVTVTQSISLTERQQRNREARRLAGAANSTATELSTCHLELETAEARATKMRHLCQTADEARQRLVHEREKRRRVEERLLSTQKGMNEEQKKALEVHQRLILQTADPTGGEQGTPRVSAYVVTIYFKVTDSLSPFEWT